MTKITFVGDIMCEEPLLKASEHSGKYDFSSVFEKCRDFFSESDYVIGNLETVFAGENAGYTKELFSFNTPDQFAEAMADSGIDMVTTATNHVLDRDVQGLTRTLDVLDKLKIEHIGSYRSEQERQYIFTKTFEEKKIAFLNYTYGTNLNESPYVIDDKDYYLLNLLMPQKRVRSRVKKGLKGSVSKFIYKYIGLKNLLKIKTFLGRECANRYQDGIDKNNIVDTYIERIKDDVTKAKNEADVVIVCLHIGGQFNEKVGSQVGYFTDLFADLGVDYIIDTHAHVVQNCEYKKSAFIANCLGNFSISPSSLYVPHELKPEYSIAFHMNIDSGSVRKSFSVLKILENKKHEISVIPVDILLNELDDNGKKRLKEDVDFIYNRFTGKTNSDGIRHEYLFEV